MSAVIPFCDIWVGRKQAVPRFDNLSWCLCSNFLRVAERISVQVIVSKDGPTNISCPTCSSYNVNLILLHIEVRFMFSPLKLGRLINTTEAEHRRDLGNKK